MGRFCRFGKRMVRALTIFVGIAVEVDEHNLLVPTVAHGRTALDCRQIWQAKWGREEGDQNLEGKGAFSAPPAFVLVR
jgi:hypothetical protein